MPARATAFLLLLLALFAGAAGAQSPQWVAEPVGPGGAPVLDGAQAYASRQHVAALDANGNLFIAGHYYASPSSTFPESEGQFLGKYDATTGAELWRYTAPPASFLLAVAVNGAGDAFVTGQLTNVAGSHHYVARISGATGTVMWQQVGAPGESPTGEDTYGVDLTLDIAGNPVVLGYKRGFAIVTRLAADTGAVLWSVQPAYDKLTPQRPFGIAADPAGNVIGITYSGEAVSGSTPTAVLFKLDGAIGDRMWASVLNVQAPQIRAFTLDDAGKPTVAGTSIWKFENVDGSLDWQRTLTGDATPSTAYGVATASNGDVFATGTAGSTGNTVVTARFVSASGATVWSATLAGTDPAHANQIGKSVAVDADGNVIVAAQVFYPDSANVELQTLDYSGAGALLMAPRFANGSIGGAAEADLALAFGTSPYTVGRFVTVSSTGGNGTYTVGLKYAPPPAPVAANVVNLSTRGDVLTGENVLIGGFVIGGSTPKTVVVRARGPSLAASGVASPLADPVLTLVRSSDQSVIATNDNWGDAANASQLSASGYAPPDTHEAAIYVTLAPGAYTGIVSGANGGTGVGIVEVFEVDHPESPLVDVATRGDVLTGDNVLIGGFVIQGSNPRTVLLRARGPSLAAFGVANPLANPTLTLVRSSDQSLVASNDNWGDAANASQVAASGFAPSDPNESAILVTLPPGAYTAIMAGANGGTGVGIVEVFAQ